MIAPVYSTSPSTSNTLSLSLPDYIPASIPSLQADIAKRSLKEFVHFAWPIVEPQTKLSWNWHLDILCDVLTKVTEGKIKRLIINIPPGCMKSLLVSVFWPAWEWTNEAYLRYLTFSYSDKNTLRDNRRVRSIVTSEWYTSAFNTEDNPVTLSSDQYAKVRFDTESTGWRIASSVGGQGTGDHPDRIIIDDPIKADEYETQIDAVNDWADNTVSTRVNRDPAIILVMQRLHQKDLTAHLLAKGGWTHLMLPMRFEPDRADPLDQRAQPGELLWPEKFPEEKVRRLEIDLGQFGASGQLQQRPVPPGGGLFKRRYFKPVPFAPLSARRCRGWDVADTEGGGNWTSGTKVAVADDGKIYIEHNVKDQLGPGDVDSLIILTAKADGYGTKIVEGSGSGKATIAARGKALAGYDYTPMPETTKSGDKVKRASPFRAQAELGNVYIVVGDREEWNDWVEPYLDQVCSFPVGKWDDDVDSTAHAYNALVQEEEEVEVELVW